MGRNHPRTYPQLPLALGANHPDNCLPVDSPQLLFFDRNIPLGSPTRNPKPYITVLPAGDDTVTVQYQWQIGSDQECCPTGIGTVRFHIGSDGKLEALGSIPHQ